ncbi:MAG: hypothetical protein RSC66_10945, partial [Comamonas sp.]
MNFMALDFQDLTRFLCHAADDSSKDEKPCSHGFSSAYLQDEISRGIHLPNQLDLQIRNSVIIDIQD